MADLFAPETEASAAMNTARALVPYLARFALDANRTSNRRHHLLTQNVPHNLFIALPRFEDAPKRPLSTRHSLAPKGKESSWNLTTPMTLEHKPQ